MLAENSAKSAFSDQLAQRAWRRLFWADNFRARVIAAAPIADIDAAWNAYIDADAEWNTNIMISIVGLEHYYDSKRSVELEGKIQDMFSDLDTKLASLRRSDALKAIRAGSEPTSQQRRRDGETLADQAKRTSDALKVELYVLVRCVLHPVAEPRTFASESHDRLTGLAEASNSATAGQTCGEMDLGCGEASPIAGGADQC